MFKSKIFATFTLVMAAVAVLTVMTLARTAFAADDVFMDEGDGDFDSMPAQAPAPVAQVPAKENTAVPKIAAPRPAAPELDSSDQIPLLTDDSSQPAATPAPTEDPSAPAAAEPKAKKASKKKKAAAKKAAATASSDERPAAKSAGSFVTTKEACPMMRSPASTGETMLTVKASKKIWVEDAGEGWVKAYNKAGEPGYVSKECVN
jgi:cytoskeletal protein RodZ